MSDSVILKLDPAALQVKPGAQVVARLTVRNRTEEVGNYLITIEGVPAGWASASTSGWTGRPSAGWKPP